MMISTSLDRAESICDLTEKPLSLKLFVLIHLRYSSYHPFSSSIPASLLSLILSKLYLSFCLHTLASPIAPSRSVHKGTPVCA